MLFGIAGRKGHGKDACADIMVATDPANVVKMAFADPIKEACAALFSFSHAQLHDTKAKETVDPRWGITPRRAMQYLGTDLIQKHMDPLLPGIANKFFVEAMRHRILDIWQTNVDAIVIISDVRFQHEVELIHELGGYILRVTRPSLCLAPTKDTHVSETSVDTLTGVDEDIVNDGNLEDLEGAIKEAGERIVARMACDKTSLSETQYPGFGDKNKVFDFDNE